jgi:hypothetical protein
MNKKPASKEAGFFMRQKPFWPSRFGAAHPKYRRYAGGQHRAGC